MEPRPDDPYGASKLAVETDLRLANERFGLNYVAIRPHNVYGERQNMAPRGKNVVAVFVNQCLMGQPNTIWGEGNQVRAFTHVDDVAPLFARAPLVKAARNQVFNVGADRTYTILELAHEVAAAVGVRPNVVHLPARNEIAQVIADQTRLKRTFAPPPEVDLPTGLRRMVGWAKERGPAVQPAVETLELADKLNSA
jgi:UDP-glucose 4-epimerase